MQLYPHTVRAGFDRCVFRPGYNPRRAVIVRLIRKNRTDTPGVDYKPVAKRPDHLAMRVASREVVGVEGRFISVDVRYQRDSWSFGIIRARSAMALMQVDFFSETLEMCASMNVILPEPSSGLIGQDVVTRDETPVLYLLHGRSDDHTIWLRRTSVERYAAAYGIAVVMPAVARSFYTDMASGPKYWSFISEELPALVDRFFRVASTRERTFVAGLSMGGYGALKLCLNYPERFIGAASFSGVTDAVSIAKWFRPGAGSDHERLEFLSIFGDPPDIEGTNRDLFDLSRRMAEKSADFPALYVSCGTEDELIGMNRDFKKHLERLEIPVEYREEPGTHEWGFWDRHIREFLEWLSSRDLL